MTEPEPFLRTVVLREYTVRQFGQFQPKRVLQFHPYLTPTPERVDSGQKGTVIRPLSGRTCSPRSRPRPRKLSTELRLALSNEALKTNGTSSSAVIAFKRSVRVGKLGAGAPLVVSGPGAHSGGRESD